MGCFSSCKYPGFDQLVEKKVGELLIGDILPDLLNKKNPRLIVLQLLIHIYKLLGNYLLMLLQQILFDCIFKLKNLDIIGGKVMQIELLIGFPIKFVIFQPLLLNPFITISQMARVLIHYARLRSEYRSGSTFFSFSIHQASQLIIYRLCLNARKKLDTSENKNLQLATLRPQFSQFQPKIFFLSILILLQLQILQLIKSAMKIQQIRDSVIYAFQLEQIFDRIHSHHQQQLANSQREKQKLSVPFVLSPDGAHLPQLFGYHLGQKLQGKSFFEVFNTFPQVLTESTLLKYCSTIWPDLGKFELVIPVLFRIMKTGYGGISLKSFDQYIQICKKDMNPLIIQLKESVPPVQLRKFIGKLEQKCEKEDLINSGYVQKFFVQQFYKKQLKIAPPQWPKELLKVGSNNQVNYKILTGSNYLRAGENIMLFLKGMLVRKIKRALQKVAANKKKGQKKVVKKKTGRSIKVAQKVNKNEKLVQTYIEANKQIKKQSSNRNKFMVKQLLQELIQNVVQLKISGDSNEEGKQGRITRSIYITQPEFPQIQYDSPNIQINKVKFAGNNGLGMFVSHNKGYIMDILKSTKKSEFQLNLSSIFKQSPIIQFQIVDQMLYLLKQNGLLYSWPITGETFLHKIQTSFKKPNSPRSNLTYNFIKIKHGVISINCTHQTYNRVELYNMDLEYIGIIQLNPQQYGISYRICQQSYLLERITRKISMDNKISIFQNYFNLFENQIQQNSLQLGKMLFQAKQQIITYTITELRQYAKWIISWKSENQIILPEKISSMLVSDKNNPELLSYLQKLGYINEPTVSQLDCFLQTNNIGHTENRKSDLLCLYEDNNLNQIYSPFLTKQQFSNWISAACLMQQELKSLHSTLLYRPDGRVDLSKLFYNEHYKRITDLKVNRYNPDKYKYQELPPICIKQFVVLSSSQLLIFTLAFPFSYKLYIVNMLNGNLTNTYDLSSLSYSPVLLRECFKNGYIFSVSGKSVNLWNSQSFCSGPVIPIQQWENLQSKDIIDLVVVYELSTVITLTHDTAKIWDFDELCRRTQKRETFRIKPGYRAIQIKDNKSSYSKMYKKKILLRQTAISLYYFLSPNQNIIFGAVSSSKNQKYYIKSYTINKFKVIVSSHRQHYQIPLKLTKELQFMALKRKNLPPTNRFKWMSEWQRSFQGRMASRIHQKMLEVSNSIKQPNLTTDLQVKLNSLAHSVSSIYQKSMFKNKQRSNRIQNFFTLLTLQKISSATQILQARFLDLYKGENEGEYHLEKILQDSMTTTEKRSINRCLYVLSLIEKFSRPLVLSGNKLIKYISKDRSFLDEDLIISLLPTQLPLDYRIISKVVKTINCLQNPVKIALKIIDSYLPTRYRYLVPRYLKQIYQCKQSTQMNEYIQNRYEGDPTQEQLAKRLKGEGRPSGIHQYIIENNLLKYVKQEVSSLFPLVENCNYSLIEALLCLKIISEDEAIYYCVKESAQPEQRLSSKLKQFNIEQEVDFDLLLKRIQAVMKEKKLDLPTPKINYSFFEQHFFQEKSRFAYRQLFFRYLNGNRKNEQVVTDALLNALKLVEKRISVKYRESQWKWIMGKRITALQHNYNRLLQIFPFDYRVVSVLDFKTAIMGFIDDESVYEDLVLRAAFACTNSNELLDRWRKSDGMNLETEGMWINLNYLFKFIQQYNPLLLELELRSEERKNYKLQLPIYTIIKKIEGDSKFVSKSKFRELLTLNLSPLSLLNIDEILDKYFRSNQKKITFYEIRQLMLNSDITIGKYLVDKYHRIDFQNRFTIVNQSISSSQLIQFIGSHNLTVYLFGDRFSGIEEFISTTKVFQKLNNLINPAANKLSIIFSVKLHPLMIELLQYQEKKSNLLPALSLAQMLHMNHLQHPIVISLLKFMTGQPNSAQFISTKFLTQHLQKTRKLYEIQYQNYIQKLAVKSQEQNLISMFLQEAQPQDFPFTVEDAPKSYLLTHENIRQIFGQYQWFINFKPYASIKQFIDHVREKERQEEIIEIAKVLFTESCVCRVGISQIMNCIGQNPSFSQFYQNLRSSFKSMSKVDTKILALLYLEIVKNSDQSQCDTSGIRHLSQEFIPVGKKAQWICALYDRSLIQDPLQNQQFTLDCELKIEKIKNLYDTKVSQQQRKNEIEQVKRSLDYRKYLLNKYLNGDPIKLRQLNECVKQNNFNELKSLLQFYGVQNKIHLEQLVLYYRKEVGQIQPKSILVTESAPKEQLKQLIQKIKSKPKFLNYSIWPYQQLGVSRFESQYRQIYKFTKGTKAFQLFTQTGASDYYFTYHSFLNYCTASLQTMVVSEKNRDKVKNQIKDYLISKNLSPHKLYELLDMSTYENISKYLPQVVFKGNQSSLERAEIRKIVQQFSRPDKNKLKYPLNSNDFEKMLSDLNSAHLKQRKQYEYLYSELDILGAGYVNINEIPKYRGTTPSFLSPYVYIPSYIDQLNEKDNSQKRILPSKYVGPILDPPEKEEIRQKICEKLMKYQIPVSKTQKKKLIKTDVCLAIMGQFGVAQNHQYQQFIKQKFTIQVNGLVDLSGIIDWLLHSLVEEAEEEQKKIIGQRTVKLQKFMTEIDNQGGLYRFLEKKKGSQLTQKLYCTILQVLSQQNIQDSQLLNSKQLSPLQKFQIATLLTKKIIESYFVINKKWDTFNNSFCSQIKNMAQQYYSLVFKFYSAHNLTDMHQIYHEASQFGEFTLLTLWRYIQDKGVTGYSRADINQLFSAIDINSDTKLSYFQFCQFWMACDQLFSKMKEKYKSSSNIDSINQQVKDIFLQLCEVELENYPNEILTIEQLVKLTNISNVEKIDYIVKAINSSSRASGPVSGSYETKIELRKSQLKILVEKMKQKSSSNLQNLREDLIIYGSASDLGSYFLEGYNIVNIGKIILIKYPTLGYEIVQHFQDKYQMSQAKLTEAYRSVQDKINPQQHKKDENMIGKMKQLNNQIEQFYRKHSFRVISYEHRQFGTSIAFRLLSEKITKSISGIQNQIQQIQTFLDKHELPVVPLYYQLDEVKTEFLLHEAQPLLKSVPSEFINNCKFSRILDHFENQLYQIRFTLYSHKEIKFNNLETKQQIFVKREIIWKDTDLACKSENKPNLMLFSQLYLDPLISLVPVSPQSTRFKIEGSYNFKLQYTSIYQLAPILPEKQLRPELIDRVMSLLKYICQKLIYCYYKHYVTGLLILPNNLCVNIKNNQDIKFSHFLTAFSLNPALIKNRQQTVSYVDGIDPKYFTTPFLTYPPDVNLQLYTEAIDVYILANIVYSIFKLSLHFGEQSKDSQKPASCEQQPIWNWSSSLHEVALQQLKNSNEEMTEKERNLWVIFYQCTQHDWFLRPRLHQIQQVIENYFLEGQATLYDTIFQSKNRIEIFLETLEFGSVQDSLEMLQSVPKNNWKLGNIKRIQEILKGMKDLEGSLLEYYNSVLECFAESQQIQNRVEDMRQYLTNVVDYLLMIPASKAGFCFIVNKAYKNILNSSQIKRYLSWCDENWKIEEYEISKKLEKVNMSDKLQILHKNSSFYHDIATLAQCRVTLSENDPSKKFDTSKKVAISFITNCLVSNNINKIYAVYRSEVLKSIYTYISKQQLQPYIISIFEIASTSLNPNLYINRYKTVDEVYKVMMVISNSLKPSIQREEIKKISKNSSIRMKQSDSKINKSQIKNESKVNFQNQSIISMQDYVNNYYTLSGQQCREIVLSEICKQHLCTLPVITTLFNQVDISKLGVIISNLCYDKKIQKMLRTAVCGNYLTKLRQNKMESLIQSIKKAVVHHKETFSIGDLSTTLLNRSNFCLLCKNHLDLYEWYFRVPKHEKQQNITIEHQRNFYQYFLSFLARSQKIYERQYQYAEINLESLEVVNIVIKMHRVMFDLWTKLPCHQDYTAATLRFLMSALENIYNHDNLYLKHKINSETTPDLLLILRRFWLQEDQISSRHDLPQIAIDNGFIQFYCRTVIKQLSLMQKYIEKNVQNIHMTENYYPQAEFRLVTFYLMVQNELHTTEICQVLIANQFPMYIVDKMLQNITPLDLRFYKATNEIVPFRYCHPYRAQAIAMIGFVLNKRSLILSDQISSRLVPYLSKQISNILNEKLEELEEKMKWVQSIWLLGNIANVQNQRLKYEFINLKLHEILISITEKFPFLMRFFPQMTQTLRASRNLVSSLAKSQLLQ